MLQHIQPVFEFSKLIIVEPMISVEGGHHLDNLRSRLVLNSSRRQKIWRSKEEVYKSLQKARTRNWDPRVVQAFMVCHFLSLNSKDVCAECGRLLHRIMLFIEIHKRNYSLFRVVQNKKLSVLHTMTNDPSDVNFDFVGYV